MIPSNLNECFEVLDIMLTSQDQLNIKQMTEDEFMHASHHFLGQKIRNDWHLWKANSPLFHHLKDMGLWHADDMSGLILTSYWRSKNKKPLQITAQIKAYQDYWQKEQVKYAEDNCTD